MALNLNHYYFYSFEHSIPADGYLPVGCHPNLNIQICGNQLILNN